MDYLTQYYKNNVIALQQELEHLTEVYNFKLNEAKEPEPGILQWLTGRKAREAAETAAQTGARSIVPEVPAVVETAAQRTTRLADEARARLAAQLAAKVAARQARQGVIRALQDIAPENWIAWFNDPNTTQAQKDAFRLLFPQGMVSGNLPGQGIVPLQRVNDNGRIRILWWDSANDTWRWVGKNTNTGAGNVGPLGYIPSVKSGPQISSIENIDNLQYAHSLSDKKNFGQNTGNNTSLNTELGGYMALNMSYDAKFVSKKIKFLYES